MRKSSRVSVKWRTAVATVCALTMFSCGQGNDPQALVMVSDEPVRAEALTFNFHYQRLMTLFLDAQGRVVDGSDERKITTSEGQSYAMLFALVANDQERFAQILRWTENNLAQGDLTSHLPAWLWGKKEDDSWGIIDANSASDADIILAYALLQAGEKWQQPRYAALGERLAWRILQQETLLFGQHRWLLPGYFGFVNERKGTVKLNLSYYAMPILLYFTKRFPYEEWQQVYDSGFTLAKLHTSGFSSDWIVIRENGELAEEQQAEADYDAIRTYYWWALAAPHHSQEKVDLTRWHGVVDANVKLGAMALESNWLTGEYSGSGPIGFSAATLPLLDVLSPREAEQQRQRIVAMNPELYRTNYYDTMLLLYGIGADQGCLGFDKSGNLITDWRNSECLHVSD